MTDVTHQRAIARVARWCADAIRSGISAQDVPAYVRRRMAEAPPEELDAIEEALRIQFQADSVAPKKPS